MTAYFDLENFKTFFSAIDENPNGYEILRLLKKQLHVHLNFKLEEMDEYLEIQLQEFKEGVSENFELTHSNDILGGRPVDKKIKLSDLNGIYLINDPISEALIRKFEVLTANVGEEIKVLSDLIFCEEDYGFHDERTINEADFNSWSKIEKYVLPFSTLLLVDRYIFKGSSVAGNLGLLEYNFGKILKEFYKNKISKARLIFLCQIDPFNNNPNYADKGPDFKELCVRINNIIKSINKNIPMPEIVLACVPINRNGRLPIDDEHDRNLITNYFRVKCGDSFVKFFASGEITGARTNLDFYSHGRRKYKENTNIIVQNVANIIEELRSRYPNYFHSNFELNSNIINF